MFNVIVCGGRDYKNKEKVFKVLDGILLQKEDPPPLIIEGGAIGADTFAKEWAIAREQSCVKYIEYRADWDKHGKAAGPIRNAEMLKNHDVDLVVAFKGGRGTEDMINKALAKNIIVLRVEE